MAAPNPARATAFDAIGKLHRIRRSARHHDNVAVPNDIFDVALESAFDRRVFDKRLRQIPATPVIMLEMENWNRWLLAPRRSIVSFATNQAVSTVIGQRFPATLQLFAISLLVALVLAIFLGVISAIRQNSPLDYTVTTISYFGLAMPAFLLGLFLQDIFAVQLHWLPVSGTSTLGMTYDPFNAFIDHLLHLVLPVIALSVLFVAGWSRYMRSSMIETTKQDYMRTARAKGVSPTSSLVRHALRNAVIPLITVVAIDFGAIAGGATITEGIFAWPGMGSLFFDSLQSRDFPVLLAILLLSGFFVVLFNLIADVLYGVMDPRIRYS